MANELTHFSLFSGIGGLDLAAEYAGFSTIGQCEIDSFCGEILKRRFKEVHNYVDIKTVSAGRVAQFGVNKVTVLSGGFPCQPHSTAGLRKASADERDLWGEFRRVIGDLKSKWVVAENVRGLFSSENGQFFRGILRDFAILGYNAVWLTLSAVEIGAIHKRERVAIIAYSNEKRLQGRFFTDRPKEADEQFKRLSLHLFTQASENDLRKSVIYGGVNGIPCGVDRLGALGNAVVPAQFYHVFKAIADIERYA